MWLKVLYHQKGNMSPEFGIVAEKQFAVGPSNLGIAAVGEIFIDPFAWRSGLGLFAAIGDAGYSLASAVGGSLLRASVALGYVSVPDLDTPAAVQPNITSSLGGAV